VKNATISIDAQIKKSAHWLPELALVSLVVGCRAAIEKLGPYADSVEVIKVTSEMSGANSVYCNVKMILADIGSESKVEVEVREFFLYSCAEPPTFRAATTLGSSLCEKLISRTKHVLKEVLGGAQMRTARAQSFLNHLE